MLFITSDCGQWLFLCKADYWLDNNTKLTERTAFTNLVFKLSKELNAACTTDNSQAVLFRNFCSPIITTL